MTVSRAMIPGVCALAILIFAAHFDILFGATS